MPSPIVNEFITVNLSKNLITDLKHFNMLTIWIIQIHEKKHMIWVM